MKNPDYLSVARKIVESRHTGCDEAFVAGSIVRGEASATSDIDLVIFYNDPGFEHTGRASFTFEHWPVEAFIHTQATLEYFFDDDAKNGYCGLSSMISDGLPLKDSVVGQKLKDQAKTIIEHGPLRLTQDEIEDRLYMLTDCLDDIKGYRNKAELYASLAVLFQNLGDFWLRANHLWSGKGKTLLRNLTRANPALASDYIGTFEKAYTTQDIAPLIDFTENTLAPLGGRVFEGYERPVPVTCAAVAVEKQK